MLSCVSEYSYPWKNRCGDELGVWYLEQSQMLHHLYDLYLRVRIIPRPSMRYVSPFVASQTVVRYWTSVTSILDAGTRQPWQVCTAHWFVTRLPAVDYLPTCESLGPRCFVCCCPVHEADWRLGIDLQMFNHIHLRPSTTQHWLISKTNNDLIIIQTDLEIVCRILSSSNW